MTSLVKGFPTPLSAVHLYLSLFFPRKTFKGIVTTALSETLLQVIVGFSFPSAEQFKINSAGAIMVWLLEEMILLGGPTKSNWSLHLTEKTCCGFHIFARSTLKNAMPTTASLSWFPVEVLNFSLNFYSHINTGWGIQNTNYGEKCHCDKWLLILPLW